MADSGLDVSIVIVNWNTRELLRDCLRSLAEQTREVTFEVFVVDNASGDDSAAMVRTEFPHVHLIANPENRGFAAANNQALRIARGRYALLLNPDTLLLDNAITTMVRYMDARPDVGCAGCQVLGNQETIQRTCFRFPSPLHLLFSLTKLEWAFPRSSVFGRYFMGSWDRRSERDVDVVSGMFMLMRRAAFEQVGPMDEDYFVYAEEADWCYRAWQHGWRCRFTPVARIIHRDGGSKSTEQARVRMFVQQQKSLLVFQRKNLGWVAWAVAKLIFIGAMLPRYLLWQIAALLGGRLAAARKAPCALAALKYHLLGIEPCQ